MVSQDDPNTGVRLERTFALAAEGSQLTFTQTIVNVSERVVETCHWSRTFANGKGTCIVPVSSRSRFPNSFVRYDPPGKMLNMQPDDPQISRVGDYLIINDRPLNPKLGFDSYVGWLAYLSPQDLLFIKQFPTYPERVYNEVAGLTISVWYPDNDMIELEPIGPREILNPGAKAAFTETWTLLRYPYPGREQIDASEIADKVPSIR
jgi:hypothetical protein